MRLDDKTLAKKLESMPAPEPPPELLERLKADIPDPLEMRAGSEESGASAPAGGPWSRRPWVRLAASLVLLVGGGMLAYRIVDRAPELEGASSEDAARSRPVAPAPARPESEGVEVESADAMSADVASAEPGSEPETRLRSLGYLQGSELEEARPTASPEEPEAKDEVALRIEAPPAIEEVVTVTSESPLLDESGDADDLVMDLPESSGPRESAQADRGEGAERRRSEMQNVRIQATPVPDPEPAPAPPPPRVARKLSPMPPSTGGTTEPNDQPYGDVFFQSYGVNPFVDTEDDALSTFGFDVDTGSWGVVRRYLRDGNLPPEAAVRVEEIVNAFDYGDRSPRRGTFALTAEGAPSPWPPGERYYLLRLAAKGREIERVEQRPVDLVFVIDTSGSMNYENRLGLVKRALALLLDRLGPDDRVALVTYGSRGEVKLPLTRDEEAIRWAVERLHPDGSTNAEEGLRLAYDLAMRQGRRDAVRRILLCSDGVANVGATGPETVLERIGEGARSGIELTTVGFGMGNYNDVLMEQLADRGNGRYAYVDSLDEARRLFVEELTGTLYSIAAEARAQVEFDPEIVSRYRLLGYENRDIADERFRDDTVDAAEIGSGHTVTALYEIKLREGVEIERRGDRAFGVLRVRYRPIDGERFEEEELVLRLGMLERSASSASRAWHLATTAARFAEILRGSYWARGGDLDELARRAGRLEEQWRGDERVAELVDMIRRAARLAPSDGPRNRD